MKLIRTFDRRIKEIVPKGNRPWVAHACLGVSKVRRTRMRHVLGTCVAVFGLLAMPAVAGADTIDLSEAVLAGGASLIGGGSKIQFDAQVSGESATFTLPSIPGQQYSIQVTGHNDASSSFFQFLIDADGPGPGGFVQLGQNLNFGSGFQTVMLPTFINVGS